MNPQDFIAQLTAGPILSEKVPTTPKKVAEHGETVVSDKNSHEKN